MPQWMRTAQHPPKANGEYTTRDTVQDCDVLQYHAAHNLWYDSRGRSQSAPIWWLDERAHITEDMVKDLQFEATDLKSESSVFAEFWVAQTPIETYTIAKWHSGKWCYSFADGFLDCDDLTHGIALCNQHHKKIILSQLK